MIINIFVNIVTINVLKNIVGIDIYLHQNIGR